MNLYGGFKSIIFAPFLFPLVVWILSDKKSTARSTAKNTLWLHIIPIIFSMGMFLFIVATGFFNNNEGTRRLAVMLFIITGVVDAVLYIYNIYKGIKFLLEK